jgi:hypothetical protein
MVSGGATVVVIMVVMSVLGSGLLAAGIGI